jgi:exopolysaccharide biosynthesis polyprenyl glycosylphosphotransferase
MSPSEHDLVSRRNRRVVIGHGHDHLPARPSRGAEDAFAPSLSARTDRPGTTAAWRRLYLRRVLGVDLAVGSIAAAGASVLRFGVEHEPAYPLVILLVPVVWVFALFVSNAYERRYLGVSTEEHKAVGRALMSTLAIIGVASYLMDLDVARGFVLALIPTLLVGGLFTRHGMHRWLSGERARGRLMQRTVVVGRVDAAAELLRSIAADRGQGLHPVAVCASGMDGDWDAPSILEGVPVMGRPQDAIAAADLYDAEVVAVASHPDLAGQALRRLGWALEERNIELIVAPGLLDVAGPRLSIRPSTNLSLLHVERPANIAGSAVLKLVADRLAAAALIAGLSPLLLAVAVAIKFGDGGPVLFRQQRVGVRGELFDILKFRTMVVDAENRLEALAGHDEGNGVLFKIKADPRVTRVGRMLRRYSLDELPQLFNVLSGDMSLVGPRPPLPAEVARYEPDALRRMHVRPGMTGLWQVSGRSDLSWEESLKLDLRYVDNWSPIGDLAIIGRTFRAVTDRSGAY